MTAPPAPSPATVGPPVHVLAGAVPLPPCGGCGQPVCACTMNLGACAGFGYVHVRSRKHQCAGMASFAWPSGRDR